MIDSVLKGTGNSRFLKSAVPAGTSWADALAMLQAGTFPIDFNGINTKGFQQVGTPLNKSNLLKDATAAQIGLPPSTTPDGMFQALGNTGELHVWRKTVTTAQEIPAGYTLGSAEANVVIAEINNGYGNYEVTIAYGTSVSVLDSGIASVSGTTSSNTLGILTWGDGSNRVNALRGKFCKVSSGQGTVESRLFYVPNNATLTYKTVGVNNRLILSSLQPVNPYPLTPAGTTTTYPVSANPNAYQEGDDAKAAGYTLGEPKTTVIPIHPGNTIDPFYYGDANNVAVTNDGVVSVSSEVYVSLSPYNTNNTDSVKGKYIQGYPTGYPVTSVYYIPADATFSNANGELVCDKAQLVTGYAAIPAGTTIEYLGKLGDKARVQVVSYVGTGTYGKANPTTITFNFVPKIVIVSNQYYSDEYAYVYCAILAPVFGAGVSIYSSKSGMSKTGYSLLVKKEGKTISFYNEGNYVTAQMNASGKKYAAVAIG